MTELKKVVKLRNVISNSSGLAIATSCYIAGLQVATIIVGELAWISILVAGMCCLLSAMCFAELTSLYPSAAGIKLFIQNAFNEKTAIIIGATYTMLAIASVGAEGYLLTSVMSSTVTNFSNAFLDKLFWLAVFLLIVLAINYRGIYITGVFQDILTYGMIFFLISVSVYSLCTNGINLAPAFASTKFTLENVFKAAGVGVFLYVGYEAVAPLAEETTDYRLIGRGMLWAIGLLSVTYCLFTVGMYVGLTDEQLRSGTPIPHILYGRNLFGGAGAVFFMIMSVLASITSFNAGITNGSRFAYAMGRDNTLPRIFSTLHPRYATPWVALLILAVFAIIVMVWTLITGHYLFIIMIGAVLECFIYIVMAVCVIRLRKLKPDAPRDFKVPLGYTVPIITIIIFSGLLLGIVFDVTRDYVGNELFKNYWVAVALGAFFLMTTAYTLTVVPVLKRKAEERAQTRVKRRPGR